jgi:hypothetical protein
MKHDFKEDDQCLAEMCRVNPVAADARKVLTVRRERYRKAHRQSELF